VLNSVNVSAMLVAETLATSKVHNLPKVMALVEEHREDLEQFFRHDPRGQKLPEYCAQLAEAVARDNGAVKAELESLSKKIDLIKAVVSAQQERVRPANVAETFDVREVIDDALTIHAASCEREAIEVVCRFDDLPAVRLDRYKALQILLVLLANARDAVLANELADRRIVVQAGRGANGELEITVEDNGCGIDPELLDRVFGLGYTTKLGRRGMGLHFSACAARELKGGLKARSAGAGRGASFLLSLPLGVANGAVPPG
jgi:signal transduction histidine kinase